MGFKRIRATIVKKLKEGRIQHELDRSGSIDEKNHLAVGKISVEEVVDLLNSTKGFQYKALAHHILPEIEIHIFKPVKNKVAWYIKCYLIEPDVIFISVHH